MYLVLGVLAVLGLVAVAGEKTYTNRWDNVDVDTVLRNERLLRSYFRCVMDQGRCSPEAAELRKNIPEALGNECAKCTEKQKTSISKVMKYLYEKRREMFNQLEKKYDSQGTYRKKYENKEEVKAALEEIKAAKEVEENEKKESEQKKETGVKEKEVKLAKEEKEMQDLKETEVKENKKEETEEVKENKKEETEEVKEAEVVKVQELEAKEAEEKAASEVKS